MVCDRFISCTSSFQKKSELCNACRMEKSDSTIKCKENKKIFYLRNKSKENVIVFHVDGCVINNEAACDYLLWAPSVEKVFFVELKGTDVGKGLKQIEKTVSNLIGAFPRTDRYGYVVCRAVPKITNTGERIKIEKRLRKEYDMKLKIAENSITESL